jgi:hypothetical protein
MVGLLPALAILAALPLAYLLGSHDSRPTLAAATLVALLLAGAGVENWRTYFVELAARSAEETSELVHYLRHQPAGMATYVLGAEHFLHVTDDTNIQHFSFEFPDRTLRDIPEPQQFLPLAEHDGAAALILGPTQLGLSPSIKRLYPSAEFSDVLRSTNGDLLFRAVHLSRAAVAAGADEISRSRGLAARYEQSDGALLHRVDAQLNSFAVEALYKNQNPLPVMMPFVAVWSGRLKIHTPGTYQLDVVASGDYALALDGVAACGAGYVLPEEPSQCGVEIDLQRGLHRLTARWDSRHAAHNTRRIFQVYWTPPDGIREIIPSEQFLPDAFAGAQ